MAASRPVLDTLAHVLPSSKVTLSAPLFRRLWRDAVDRKNESRMVELVARADAPADLRVEFAACTNSRLRVAFLSRPDITTSEALATLEGESRVTVLGALAKSEAVPAAVVAALAGRCVGAQFSPKLADALLTSATLTDPDRLTLVTRYVKSVNPNRDHALVARLREAVAKLRGPAATTAVLTLPGWVCHNLIEQEGLDADTRVAIVERVLAVELQDDAKTMWGRGVADRVNTLLGLPDLQLEVMTALEAQLAPLSGGTTKVNPNQIENWRIALTHRSYGLLDPGLTPAQVTARRDQIRDARDSHDPSLLATLARAALGQQDVPLATILLANAHTPATSAAALAPLLDTRAGTHAAWTAQRGNPGRDEVRLGLLLAHPDLLVSALSTTREPLASMTEFDDPPAAATTLMLHFGADPALRLPSLQGSTAATILRTVAKAEVCEPANPLLLTPWALLWQDIDRYRPTSFTPDVLVPRTVTTLCELLGEDEDAWAVFERLAPTFTGTLADLVAVIHATASSAA